MSKVGLIIQREYYSRVKKKSFIIMSIVGPILIAALMIVPTWLATQDEDFQEIEVIDETGIFINQLENSDEVNFHFKFRSLKNAQDELNNGGQYTAVLHIPSVVVTHPGTVQLFYKSNPKRSSVNYMENQIAKVIENKKLQDRYNLTIDQISGLRPKVRIVSNKIDETGEAKETAGGLAQGVGLILAMFIYFFIFLYGVQVMRGVIEEKSNRIIEVIISSVKPFQLMLGKISGIALVAITQFLIWVILSGAIITATQAIFKDELKLGANQQIEQLEKMNPDAEQISKTESSFIQNLSNKLKMINFPLVLSCFLFYFVGGYLLYGSLFAAIGAAVDSETDTQQFMLPVTVPLILSIVFAQVVMENPDGTLAFWTSIIPFTSPIIMMVRIPVGVPYWELLLSMGTLIATFIATTALAGKIYRVGILMYGKKVNFKEMGKWLFHKS